MIPVGLPGSETTVVPAECQTSWCVSARVSRSLSLQEGPQPESEVKAPTQDMGVDVLSLEEGTPAGQQIQEAQAQFGQENLLDSFLAKAQNTEQTKWKRT